MRRTYDTTRGFYCFLSDAYWGGERWATPSSPTIGTATLFAYTLNTSAEGRETIMERRGRSYRTYLTPHAREGETAFSQRASLAVYINMVSPIADTYAGAVTGHVTRDLGPVGEYLSNVDGQGSGWAEHVEEVARWATVYGMVAVLIDAPKKPPAANRADERASGASLRAVVVPPTAWAWVDVDTDGGVTEFAYVDAPVQVPDALSQQVTLWRWNREGWERHTVSMDLTTSAPMDDLRGKLTVETRDDDGVLPEKVRGRVPVAFAYYRRDGSSRWPSGVSLVADAAMICRQVYNLLSSAEEQIRKTFFSFLAVPTPETGGKLAPETRIQVGTDTALGYSAAGGVPAYVAPNPETVAEIRAHCVFLLALALRLAGLEATMQDATAPSSGVALRIRSRGFESRAASFAKCMARYERTALDLAAAYLSMDPAKARVQYPQRFTLPDESEDLDRALTLLEKLGSQLGAEGTLAAVKQALAAALSLSDDDTAKVLDEVRAKLETPSPKPPPPFGGAAQPAAKAKLDDWEPPSDGADAPAEV